MSLINFYEKIGKGGLNNKYTNSNKAINFMHPFRAIVVGSSGSGKSNFVLNLIYETSKYGGTFNNIIIVTKNKDEPLYNYLVEKIPDVIIYEGIDNVPDLNSFDKEEQTLIIFDDLILEKDQKTIGEYYIRCRKLNCSVAYLTQSYFMTPKIIRQNANYIILKKVANLRDLNLILSEYNLNIDKKQLLNYYKKATQNISSFLLIDVNADDSKKFRINWKDYINT